MLVPQGYIIYILMNRLPGVPLEKFWLMDAAERHEIRDAFKTAYQYVISVLQSRILISEHDKDKSLLTQVKICFSRECIRCEIVTLARYRENLLWDRDTKKV